VARDAQNTAYFQNKLEVETMKIGLKYDDEPGARFEYMIVRHEPTDPQVFDYYLKNAFTNFDNTPTWKRASPHNIQRKTWQNASCNHCHGNRDLFLSESDLKDYEKKANARVVVPDGKIPPKIDKVQAVSVDTKGVRADMVVSAKWLHENLGSPGLVIVDARNESAYASGHIEGAINLNPLAADLRQPWDSDKAMELVDYAELTETLGDAGLSADDHIVVYDKNENLAGFLLWVLEYAGAERVSYLNGGVEEWETAGYHLSKEGRKLDSKRFGGVMHAEFLADNDFVQANLDNPNVVILDNRVITQVKGMIKHGEASRAGHIPGSVNVPLGTLYMDNGYLKSPEELLWVLANYDVTPDKTVVTTCNTGQFAADAFFILRYLGFSDVKVHDASWIGWTAAE